MRVPGRRSATALLLITLTVALMGCGTGAPSETQQTGAATADPSSAPPDWYGFAMTDVRTGETFAIEDFAGKVVLIETMAQWCPTCRAQEDEVIKLHDLLGNPDDLVSISLDVDVNEDEASLAEYATSLGYDWYFAVAPLGVARALGNLYSAQFLNPPVAPMLLIDRDGRAYGLPYGLKSAEALRLTVEPYLSD